MTNANQQRIPTVPLKSLTAENHYATRIATAAHANNANGPPPPLSYASCLTGQPIPSPASKPWRLITTQLGHKFETVSSLARPLIPAYTYVLTTPIS